jgi:hypothetical protein
MHRSRTVINSDEWTWWYGSRSTLRLWAKSADGEKVWENLNTVRVAHGEIPEASPVAATGRDGDGCVGQTDEKAEVQQAAPLRV